MDPASAIVGLITFGFTVIKGLNQIRKEIKDAPDQVQTLQDSAIFIDLLLKMIQEVIGRVPLHPVRPELDAYLESLYEKAENNLKKVHEVVEKIVAQNPPGGAGPDKHVIRLNWRRWFTDKGKVDDLAGKLANVRKALCEMLEFLQMNYAQHTTNSLNDMKWTVDTMALVQTYHSGRLEYMADQIGTVKHIVTMMSTNQGSHFHPPTGIAEAFSTIDSTQDVTCLVSDTLEPADNSLIDLSSVPHDTYHLPTKPRTRRPLECPPNCRCRCHYPSVTRLVPNWLASIVGQISVSTRLLHPTFSRWSLCDMATCRGDFQRAATVRWVLPFRILQGFLESRNDFHIHFSIGAPRVVSWDSPFVIAVQNGDFQGVRTLFATGKASIWDHIVSDLPLLAIACNRWQHNPTKEHLEILRLFVEAGAKTLLFEETQIYQSAHDELTGGFFTYLLGETSDESQSLATIVRTNTTAIHVFRSLLNIDPMDALEDYLDHKRAEYIDVTGFMTWLENTRCNAASRSSVFQVIDCTPLEYAVKFSPDSVESLLAHGEDAAAEPCLVYAVRLAQFKLIKPFLDAGVDVNMRDWWAHTALLEACSLCYYDGFFELLRWAEDAIDWDACAPDGRNALELFDSAVLARVVYAPFLSQSQLDKFRAALVAHMNIAEDESEGQLDMPGAFPVV